MTYAPDPLKAEAAAANGTPALREVPDIVVRRLLLYARELGLIVEEGGQFVSSQELGRRLNVTPAQIRKDLAYCGRLGRQGRGYDAAQLHGRLRAILGLDRPDQAMVLVGVGQLGGAVLRYGGFPEQGFRVVRGFDSDPAQTGREIDGVPISDVAELPAFLAANDVRMGIVAVPGREAQRVIEMLVAGGVQAILSYAPITTTVPEGVLLRRIDPVMELQGMAFYLR